MARRAKKIKFTKDAVWIRLSRRNRYLKNKRVDMYATLDERIRERFLAKLLHIEQLVSKTYRDAYVLLTQTAQKYKSVGDAFQSLKVKLETIQLLANNFAIKLCEM